MHQGLPPYRYNLRSRKGFHALREHAVKLHREKLSEEEGSLLTRRSRVQVKLSKLKPGNCCSIGALKSSDGLVMSDPRRIGNELRRYWGDSFSGGSCVTDVLEKWVQDEIAMPTLAGFQDGWVPSVKDMKRTIRTWTRWDPFFCAECLR